MIHPEADAAVTFKVLVGDGAGGISVNLFLPDQILIHQGDTVEWTNPYEEPHTVSYGNLSPGDPAAPVNATAAASFDASQAFSSGFVVKNTKFSVTFNKLGAFTFVCLIHPGMKVDVFVLGPGATAPTPADATSASVRDTVARALAAGNQAISQLKVPAATKNADGTSSHTVLTGPGIPFQGSTVGVAVMKFYDARLQIGVGDTVTWTADTLVPHTTTFIPPSGPPANINPFQTVVPSASFDGTQYVNGSYGGVPLFNATSKFSLTFTKAGTYSYVCLLHADRAWRASSSSAPPPAPAEARSLRRPPVMRASLAAAPAFG